ncbi:MULTISPECIES: ATP-grasp domain-containing protein [unclassified Microbacterium]|uniref:ATP-grasp domain-containing protein n=1 Tax=unclassified Microbacterium TaxID=2609290 RepID=UPI0030186894
MPVTSPRAPRIGIVVTDVYAAEDPDYDTPLLLPALAARGADPTAVVWHDAAVDPASFDLLVIRSPWDYPERPAEFAAWLDRAERATRVVNSPATVRWNLDKTYLRDLESAGIRVVPTTYATAADAAGAAIDAHERVVVKPAVSAGARDTGLFDASDAAAFALATRIVARGDVAMIQPEIEELSEGREKALYVIGGDLTHAISKGAILAPGGGFRGGVYRENPVPVEATPAERAFAADVLRAVRRATGGEAPLYARVDTVDSARYGLCLLEVELVEPALNLHVAPHVTGILADAIVSALGS